MRRHGLTDAEQVIAGGNTEVAGISAASELLAGRTGRRSGSVPGAPAAPPTAVITFNDRVAVGLLNAVGRAGLAAPTDLSVVGYDDSPLARLAHVALTTVSQDPPALAAAVVDVAAARLDGGTVPPGPPVEVVVAPRFVPRATTGRAPS